MIEATEEGKQYAAAWSACWAELHEIATTQEAEIPGKDGRRGFSYKYSSLGDILTVVRPILAKHGLAVSQNPVAVGDGIGVETIVSHKGGNSARYGPLPIPAGRDPRQVGSAITYARRYGLSAALGIASDEDNDAHGTFEASGAPEKESASDTSLHDDTYAYAVEQLGDAAADIFVPALGRAGIKAGDWITTEEQAKQVRGEIDAAT